MTTLGPDAQAELDALRSAIDEHIPDDGFSEEPLSHIERVRAIAESNRMFREIALGPIDAALKSEGDRRAAEMRERAAITAEAIAGAYASKTAAHAVDLIRALPLDTEAK